MNIFHKIRVFFASRSTILFLKVFFISLPVALGAIYFIFYSNYGLKYVDKKSLTRPLIDQILYEPIQHSTNAVYPPAPLRDLKEIKVYQKPDTLWEGSALEPLYELPKQGKPVTPRGD